MTSATDETAERLREHVETLAAGPRHRLENPMVLAEARDYVTERLVGAGWTVSRRPFERRAMLGVSDSGRRAGWRPGSFSTGR